jgi:hypothetical protein
VPLGHDATTTDTANNAKEDMSLPVAQLANVPNVQQYVPYCPTPPVIT